MPSAGPAVTEIPSCSGVGIAGETAPESKDAPESGALPAPAFNAESAATFSTFKESFSMVPNIQKRSPTRTIHHPSSIINHQLKNGPPEGQPSFSTIFVYPRTGA
jgi:hypothetical protein